MRDFKLKFSCAIALLSGCLLLPISVHAQPGREGPPVLVPTDVIGGRGFDAPKIESMPTAKTIHFHEKADAKKYLLETVSDTTYTRGDGQLTVERGALLVSPQDGHLVVHTPTVDVSIPKGTVALIGCTADGARVYNLSGHSVLVRVIKLDDSSEKTMDSLALDAGIGYSDYGEKTTFTGTNVLAAKLVPAHVNEMRKLKKFQLLSFDPMVVLEREPLTKQLTKEWMPTMARVEKTSGQLAEIRQE